jgi:hypothetical protein
MKTSISTLIFMSSLILLGCGTNCRQTVQMADFEASQGNRARAEKLYTEAWAADSVSCSDAGEKLQRLRLLKP